MARAAVSHAAAMAGKVDALGNEIGVVSAAALGLVSTPAIVPGTSCCFSPRVYRVCRSKRSNKKSSQTLKSHGSQKRETAFVSHENKKVPYNQRSCNANFFSPLFAHRFYRDLRVLPTVPNLAIFLE